MSYTTSKRSERQKQITNIDSLVLKIARQVYRLYQESYPELPTPYGIAVNRGTMTGKLIYSHPILLPTEIFVPIEIIESSEYH
ncbi:hypothetical protein Syn7502_00736 [Synechococcus sp. PCC 7502]|uniref:hypothetical protein n=1 Tax=Synechococcus sp. PCC 7502 TaxID=1173263 RepID=UPI00029FECC3|nr:hypothetical protein [Synechococcus sp. PCC 7502]AFY72870.1 hypothetical protein Syn7502_00736 [Synechococcus sp. PCC 7502]